MVVGQGHAGRVGGLRGRLAGHAGWLLPGRAAGRVGPRSLGAGSGAPPSLRRALVEGSALNALVAVRRGLPKLGMTLLRRALPGM